MDNIANYKKIALDARKTVLRLIYNAQTSHIGNLYIKPKGDISELYADKKEKWAIQKRT